MGIKDLAKVIDIHAPNAIRLNEIKSYFGRKIAIDASMCMYQFLIAVRQDGAQLTDENGETTSHLNGIFYRTIRMIENGIKPVYVFDGKPPQLKSTELDKRVERRADAEKQLNEAKEKGDIEAIEKFERRLVKVTKDHAEDCKKLLRLMGIPVIEAPCEAEAQCAEMVCNGKVFATATEDMDALTFGSCILTRRMTFSEAKKLPIQEISLDKVLRGFDMSMDQFVDLCILLGCDYCPTIRGIGPKKAFDLIVQYKSIENIIENIDQTKYPVPDNWLYASARELFLKPDVTNSSNFELVWNEPKIEEIIKFMCSEKTFSEDRIRVALERLQKSRKASTQGRIDCFFKSTGLSSSEPSSKKRKAEDEKKLKFNGCLTKSKRKVLKTT